MFMVAPKCGRPNSRAHFSVILRCTHIATVCVAPVYLLYEIYSCILFVLYLINLKSSVLRHSKSTKQLRG